jgi:hypothetical protein
LPVRTTGTMCDVRGAVAAEDETEAAVAALSDVTSRTCCKRGSVDRGGLLARGSALV